MEKLMSKVVAKPGFVADDRLNAKIESIFNVEAFQRMVENVDVFQDVSSFNSSFNPAASFKKVLPTHSQMQEDDDEQMPEAPRFGNS